MDDNQKLERRLALWRSDTENTRLYRDCVDLARTLSRYDLLLSLTDAALQRDPESPAIQFDRATAQIGLHDFRMALDSLAKIAVESTAQKTAIALNRGLCHFLLGDYTSVIDELTPAYERGETSAETIRMLVTAYHHIDEIENALMLARVNAPQGENNGDLAGTYALVYFDAGDATKASHWARTGLRLQPSNVDSRIVEGHLLMLRGQLDQSRQLLESVAHDAPATSRAWIGLGALALIEGHADDATPLLERGLELMPEHVGSWHLLGWTKLSQGDLTGAEQALTHALSLDVNFAESHGALAALDALRGDIGSAERRIKVAKRLDPNGIAGQYAAILITDPKLSNSQSRMAVQRIASEVATRSQSALSRFLVRSP